MKARARTILLGTLGGVVLLAGAGAALAWAVFPPGRLTPLVQRGLAEALGAPVTLGRAQLRLFPPVGVRLERLVIGDPTGFRRPAAWPRGGLAEAKSVDASVDLGALFARRLKLTSLALADARVTLVRNEAGVGNWEGIAAAKPGAKPSASSFDLSLDRFAISRARVSSYDARDGAWFDVRQLDAQLALSTGGGGRDRRLRLAARASGLGGRTPWPIGARPIELTADVESQGNGAHWLLRQVGLTRGGLKLTGHGTIDGPEQVLAFQLDQASVPFDGLLEFVPREEAKALGTLGGRGTVRLALTANGPLARGRMPAVRAGATMTGGALAFKSRALSIDDLAFDLRATEQGGVLNRLAGRVGRSVFEASGEVQSWAVPRARVHLKANADLTDVTRFLPLADSTKYAGRAQVDVQGAGAPGGEAAAFQWSGTMALAGVSVSGIGLGYPVTGVSGTIGLAPGRAWTQGLTAQLGRSDVTIDGTIEQPFAFMAQAMGTAKRRDPGAVARFALVSRSIDGDELFPARVDESPLPRVRAEGTFRLGAFRLQRLAAQDVAGRLIYQDGIVSIEDASLAAYDGHARGTAWFDLSNRVHPRYQVHATAEQVDANRLLSAWTPVKDVAFGALQMKIDLDGAGFTPAELTKSLTASGLAQVLGGKLAGATVFAKLAEITQVDRFRILSFRDLSAPFHVANGRVVFDPLALATGGTDWLAKGSVGLDGTLAFDIAALVPPGEVPGLPAQLTRVAGALLEPDGRLTLDLRLGGTVTRPTFAWNQERTVSRLFERGQQSLDALTQQVTGALADTLASSRKAIETQAAAAAEEQRKRLEADLERQKQDLGNKAMDELDRLFRKPAAPPPPPAAAAGAADTSAAGDTLRATTPAPAAPSPVTPPDSGAS